MKSPKENVYSVVSLQQKLFMWEEAIDFNEDNLIIYNSRFLLLIIVHYNYNVN